MLRELSLYLLKEVGCDIFRRGIVRGEEGKVVQHLMVKFGDHLMCHLFEFPEINAQTGGVHLPRGDLYFDPVIMPVWSGAISLVSLYAMSG